LTDNVKHNFNSFNIVTHKKLIIKAIDILTTKKAP